VIDHSSEAPIWQRSAPVVGSRIFTPTTLVLAAMAAVSLVLVGFRLASGLAPFTSMTDSYAWGIWKTFNVMTLTALGSSGLAVGVFIFVFGQARLHSVMRVSLVLSLLFYTTGLLALMADMGRPWNFWHALFPTHWNTHSALLEIAICMPSYLAVFLFTENLHPFFEWLAKKPRWSSLAKRWQGRVVKAMPLVLAGAYLLPMMHQSSLGGLMLMAGQKLHPLWQTQLLPLLYLVAAFVSGFAMVLVTLVLTCLVYRRPLDRGVVTLLGSLLSWCALVFTALRFGDLALSGKLHFAFEASAITGLFWLETLLTVVPALLLRARLSTRLQFHLALLIGTASILYRFSPTTIVFHPNGYAVYFPSVPELVISGGFIALGVLLFALIIKTFSILPDTRARAVAQERVAGLR
jgi:Ni/Fe-hydrogenase subunit HybB-like protein